MGYDMYWRREDADQVAAVEAATQAYEAAVAARNALPPEEAGQFIPEKAARYGWAARESYEGRSDRYHTADERLHAASAELYRVQVSYFRLNNRGMRRFVEAMRRLGMVFDNDPPHDWPKLEDFGVTAEQVRAAEDPEDYPTDHAALTSRDRERIDAFLAAHAQVLTWHGTADTPGIPAHKFSSNDGWLVLPDECAAAARIWRESGSRGEQTVREVLGDDLDYWQEWIAFLDGAARHDGFEVY